MNAKIAFSWIYTFLVFIGGIIGFILAGSLPSLIMGALFGLALGISVYLMMQQRKLGHIAFLITSIILLVFFSWRFVLTFSMMPAGVMTILSLIAVCWHLIKPETKKV